MERRASWCHMSLHSSRCELRGAGEQQLNTSSPNFHFIMPYPSDQFSSRTLYSLHSFLAVRPIARLWISAELTEMELSPSSDIAWHQLLSSVPAPEELAFGVNIWTASPSFLGGPNPLFRCLTDPSMRACPCLHRLLFTLTTSTFALKDCLHVMAPSWHIDKKWAYPSVRSTFP